LTRSAVLEKTSGVWMAGMVDCVARGVPLLSGRVVQVTVSSSQPSSLAHRPKITPVVPVDSV
jgi:hypothetical protein